MSLVAVMWSTIHLWEKMAFGLKLPSLVTRRVWLRGPTHSPANENTAKKRSGKIACYCVLELAYMSTSWSSTKKNTQLCVVLCVPCLLDIHQPLLPWCFTATALLSCSSFRRPVGVHTSGPKDEGGGGGVGGSACKSRLQWEPCGFMSVYRPALYLMRKASKGNFTQRKWSEKKGRAMVTDRCSLGLPGGRTGQENGVCKGKRRTISRWTAEQLEVLEERKAQMEFYQVAGRLIFE